MRIKRNSNKNKVLAIIVAAIFLLGASYVGYAYTSGTGPWRQSTSPQSSENNRSKSSSTDQDTTPEEGNPQNPESKGPNKTPQQFEEESKPAADNSTLSGVINYKTVSDDALSLRVTIDQKLDSGSCILTLTRKSDGKSVQKTVKILSNPSSSTCKGFDVPTSELGKGTWNIEIAIKSNDSTGTIKGNVAI